MKDLRGRVLRAVKLQMNDDYDFGEEDSCFPRSCVTLQSKWKYMKEYGR
jgi:hypothetical protein